jgi:hypothetical protein
VGEPLLPGDPPDEHGVRLGGVDAVPLEHVGGLDGGVEVGVDAVVDDLHPLGVEVGVGGQHVTGHALAHGDDGVGAEHRRPLGPGRHGVAAAELLGLPRTVRLQRVGRHDVRDPVQQPRQVAGHVGVPGVGVDDVAAGGRRRRSTGRC